MGRLNSSPGILDSFTNGKLNAKVPLIDFEKSIRFSLKHCDVYLNNHDFCLLKISKQEAEKLYARLGHLEELNWKQVVDLGREKGFSIEKKESEAYKKLSREFSHLTNFFHFRVNGVGTGKFRVFGGRENDLCYILLFDRNGKIHGKKHK
ncbi:MAG: hypothetical protein RBR98_00825 [Candidatus Moranbacteria bacterium]|jgi:hypothetical protein|nr:hypothetical protein [Candidatus Moranbacteria bacterium]